MLRQDEVFNCKGNTVWEVIEKGVRPTFPCSDRDMHYSAVDRQYRLTTKYLENNLSSSARDRFLQMDKNDIPTFLASVSNDVYWYIMDNAFNNFEFFSFMIATGWGFQNFNQITARREFSKALYKQAEYKLLVYDTRLLNGIDRRSGQVIGERNLRGEFRYMAEDSRKIIKGMGLVFNGTIDFGRQMFFQNNHHNF